MKLKKTALLRASLPLVLGMLSVDSSAQELVYVPLDENCRIVDTGARENSMAHEDQRGFYAWDEAGTDRMSSQGGDNCTLPAGMGRPAAMAVNVVAAGQGHGSIGNLVMYSDDTRAVPTSSMINYKGNNASNAMVINLAAEGSSHDFYIQANVFSSTKFFGGLEDKLVRIVADVMGYYYPAKNQSMHHVIKVSSVGGDFTSPVEALNSIDDATAENPYSIMIGPGTYNIGSNQMILKPHVGIKGAGRELTRIIGDIGSSNTNSIPEAAADPASSLVIGADHAVLEDLTIKNIGSGKEARAVMYNDDASPEVSRVMLMAEGSRSRVVCGMQNYGNSAPTLIDVVAKGVSTRPTSDGGGVGGGVCNTELSAPRMNNVEASGNGSLGCGVCNAGGATPQMVDVRALGQGLVSYGIQNVDEAAPQIWQSILEGETFGLSIAPGGLRTRVVDSLIVGPIDDGRPGTQECLRINDVSLNELSC